MPLKPSAPPMTQAPFKSDRDSPSRKPRQSGHYPIPPAIRQSHAHLQKQIYSGPRGYPHPSEQPSRTQGSVSSDTTNSSNTSTSKIYTPHLSSTPYQLSSHVEQGYMSPDTHRKLGEPGSPSPFSAPQSMSDTRRSGTDDNSVVFRYIQEHEAEPQPEHTIWVLTFLSFLDPFFSAFCAIYSVVVSLILLLCAPFLICRPSYSLGDNTIRLLAPLFRKHLQLMYAASVEDAHTFDFKPFMLVMVHLASPILSVGVSISAWVAASFWLFALMMGNPDGTERGDDGKAAVLGVRNWFEKFLLNAIRRQRN